ncbi:MAG: flagellar hook-associated protein FlgK [Cellvibrionaceae bacterium]|jgi:flagellar hook-associated protein FlgK
MVNVSGGLGAGVSSVFQQGVNGLQNSSRSMLESANELVSSGVVERTTGVATDIVEPMINIQKQQNLFDASAKVVQVADEALGALIDIKT